MEPFLARIDNGRSAPLGGETRTANPRLDCVTVIRGNRVVQIDACGVGEPDGSGPCRDLASVVCLTFSTEDGRRFFRTYESVPGEVVVTTSEPAIVQDPEPDPSRRNAPPCLWHA